LTVKPSDKEKKVLSSAGEIDDLCWYCFYHDKKQSKATNLVYGVPTCEEHQYLVARLMEDEI